MRGLFKRLTRIDTWWKLYTQRSGRSQHRVDKKVYNKQIRRIGKLEAKQRGD